MVHTVYGLKIIRELTEHLFFRRVQNWSLKHFSRVLTTNILTFYINWLNHSSIMRKYLYRSSTSIISDYSEKSHWDAPVQVDVLQDFKFSAHPLLSDAAVSVPWFSLDLFFHIWPVDHQQCLASTTCNFFLALAVLFCRTVVELSTKQMYWHFDHFDHQLNNSLIHICNWEVFNVLNFRTYKSLILLVFSSNLNSRFFKLL